MFHSSKQTISELFRMKILSFSKIVDLIFGIAKWDDFFFLEAALEGVKTRPILLVQNERF